MNPMINNPSQNPTVGSVQAPAVAIKTTETGSKEATQPLAIPKPGEPLRKTQTSEFTKGLAIVGAVIVGAPVAVILFPITIGAGVGAFVGALANSDSSLKPGDPGVSKLALTAVGAAAGVGVAVFIAKLIVGAALALFAATPAGWVLMGIGAAVLLAAFIHSKMSPEQILTPSEKRLKEAQEITNKAQDNIKRYGAGYPAREYAIELEQGLERIYRQDIWKGNGDIKQIKQTLANREALEGAMQKQIGPIGQSDYASIESRAEAVNVKVDQLNKMLGALKEDPPFTQDDLANRDKALKLQNETRLEKAQYKAIIAHQNASKQDPAKLKQREEAHESRLAEYNKLNNDNIEALEAYKTPVQAYDKAYLGLVDQLIMLSGVKQSLEREKNQIDILKAQLKPLSATGITTTESAEAKEKVAISGDLTPSMAIDQAKAALQEILVAGG